ncbi:hypothetical protein KUTeg_011011 [Tegillarca granosa]|uniref:Uncharacterized protein n=1 Tax=Tegillarca granosa TaxID=220873 RepID=A0ABQ9F4Z7_TEGGR|nr:hypothetical protein KUTeg_011011 [Tegillarca granosa]
MSYIISDIVCAPLDHPLRPQLFSTSVFMSGLTTIVNSAIGIRLPIFQGPSASYIPPLLVMKTAGGWTCPSSGSPGNDIEILSPNYLQKVDSRWMDTPSLGILGNDIGFDPPTPTHKSEERMAGPATLGSPAYNGTQSNMTSIISNGTLPELTVQYSRLRELQGSLILALAFEFAFGAFGMMGILMRLIGPLTFSVTITMIGLSLYPVAIRFCSAHWGLSLL